jgi:hypothetical protein
MHIYLFYTLLHPPFHILKWFKNELLFLHLVNHDPYLTTLKFYNVSSLLIFELSCDLHLLTLISMTVVATLSSGGITVVSMILGSCGWSSGNLYLGRGSKWNVVMGGGVWRWSSDEWWRCFSIVLLASFSHSLCFNFFFISSFCFPFPNLISLISFLLILTYLLFNFRFICLWQGWNCTKLLPII